MGVVNPTTMKTTPKLNTRLLALLGERLSRAAAPLPDPWLARFSLVALNPQPLPPGPPEELGAAIAADFIQMFRMADRFGLDQARILAAVEDLCPLPPKLPKLPWDWVIHLPIPVPRPNWHLDLLLGFAARLSVESFEGTRLGESVGKARDLSVKTVDAWAAKG